MAIWKAVVGESAQTYRHEKQDKERIKAGLKKFTEAMVKDEKKEASRGSSLPKDWRNRVLK